MGGYVRDAAESLVDLERAQLRIAVARANHEATGRLP